MLDEALQQDERQRISAAEQDVSEWLRESVHRTLVGLFDHDDVRLVVLWFQVERDGGDGGRPSAGSEYEASTGFDLHDLGMVAKLERAEADGVVKA
jgi:hypothetical protein